MKLHLRSSKLLNFSIEILIASRSRRILKIHAGLQCKCYLCYGKEINTEDRKSGRNSIIAPKQLYFALLDLIIALNSGKFCFSDI